MNPLRDAAKTLRPVVLRIEGGHQGQQHLEVQMLDVARSRRMCCSRVCSASRRQADRWRRRWPPTMRPGSWRSKPLHRQERRVARRTPSARRTVARIPPQHRHPYPRAHRSRTAPGGRRSPSAAPPPVHLATALRSRLRRSGRMPTSTPKQSRRAARPATVPADAGAPMGSAWSGRTASVCGIRSRSTAKVSPPTRWKPVAIASAAAVGSSTSEALATGRPVRSATNVWNVSRPSRRPLRDLVMGRVRGVPRGFCSTFG